MYTSQQSSNIKQRIEEATVTNANRVAAGKALSTSQAYATGIRKLADAKFKDNSTQCYLEESENGVSFNAARTPEKSEIKEFREKNEKNLSRIVNSVHGLDPSKDEDVARIMMSAGTKGEFDSKINNSVFDPISPRSIVIPTLLQPIQEDFGEFVDTDPQTGKTFTKKITFDDYVSEHPTASSVGIDIGYKNIVIGEESYAGNFGYVRQNSVAPSMNTDLTQNSILGDTAKIEANLFCMSSTMQLSAIEAHSYQINTQFNMSDPFQKNAERMRRNIELAMKADILTGNGGPDAFNSFAKQVGETASEGFLAPYLTVGQGDIFASLNDANFILALEATAKYILANDAGKQTNFRFDTIATCDFRDLQVKTIAYGNLNFSGFAFSSYEAFINQYGRLTRLNVMRAYLREVLGRPNFRILPADFYIPNNSNAHSGRVGLFGRNPFGNAPIMKLYASNNQDQLQYLCKIPMQASLGNMQYTNFVGDKVMHSMNVYSEFKLRNPASSVLITTPLV